VAHHGGEFLVRGGAATQLEGEGRARNVIIKWPDVKVKNYASGRFLRLQCLALVFISVRLVG
jgi:uncharacterized protein (DUF1330 family)